MKTSIRFRLIAALCAATLFISTLGFLPIHVQADQAEDAIEAAKKLEQSADDLAKAAAAAKDAAAKAAADAKKAAEKGGADAKKSADEDAKETDKDKAADDKAKQADEAAKAADQAKEKAEKAEQEAKDAEKDAADSGSDKEKDEKAKQEKDEAEAAKTEAEEKEAAAAKAEEEAAAADKDAAAEDEKIKNRKVKKQKAEARRLRDLARKARRAAAKKIREAKRLLEAKRKKGGGKKKEKKDDKDKTPPEKTPEEVLEELEGKLGLTPKSYEPPRQGTVIPPGARGTVQTKTANGLSTVTFDTVPGNIIVNLPDDMRAGDTISGTVIAEPQGQTQEERTKNQVELRDYVVAIFFADPQSPGTPPIVTFDLSKGLSQSRGSTIVSETFAAPNKVNVSLFLMPNENSSPGPCRRSGSIVAINESCSPISQLVFTQPSGAFINPDPMPMPTPTLTFVVPHLGQTGRPTVITGPFDGDSTNTGVTFQPVLPVNPNVVPSTPGTSFPVIAESPRQSIVQIPTNVTGPLQVTVKEGDKQTTSPYRSVDVNLSAPKTNLLKGEQTTLTVQVTGLEGIKEPVPLTLECKGVITMEGGIYQPLVIQPSEVGADGRYSTTRGITGVQPGGWGATATVVTSRFDVCITDDSNRHSGILWNTFTGDYIFTNSGLPKPPGQPPQTGSTTPPSLTGKGKIERKGCILTLTHNAPDRRVMSRLDGCNKTGDASVQGSSPATSFTITDRNIADNTCPSK